MRKWTKILAASFLASLPAAFVSAQDYQGGQDRQSRRQFGNGGNGGYGNGGDNQYNDRQSRRQNGGFGNGGYGNGSYGNGGGFNNGGSDQFGGRRRFNSDNSNNFGNSGGFRNNSSSDSSSSNSSSNSTSSNSSSITRSDSGRTAFVPPVPTGPITFKAQQLPKDYALLLSRSIFSKDHRSLQPDAPKPAVFADAPVAALVFKGAIRLETGTRPFQAQIEDVNSSKTPTWVGEGDLLTSSGARITEITLDHIVVEKNGARRLITIGVNLDQGEKLATQSPATGNPTPNGASGSGAASTVKIAASDTGATSDEAVADMMRHRRQQEMGQ